MSPRSASPDGRSRQFAYALTASEIEAGIRSCTSNARRLRDAAEAAMRRSDAGVALFLACIRIEEVSKIRLLREAQCGRLPTDSWSDFWKTFRSHPKKWATFKVGYMSDLKGMTKADRDRLLRKGAWRDATFKDLGLYVDFRQGRGWLEPSRLPLGPQVSHVLAFGDEWLARTQERP